MKYTKDPEFEYQDAQHYDPTKWITMWYDVIDWTEDHTYWCRLFNYVKVGEYTFRKIEK